MSTRPRGRSRTGSPGGGRIWERATPWHAWEATLVTGVTYRHPGLLAKTVTTLDVLARHCETEGRDPSGIEKTIITGSDPLDDADAFVAGMEEYARLGIEKVWVGPPGPEPAAWVEKVTEKVVPKLRDL